MKQIQGVIEEMTDYLEQEYEPPLDKLENWIERLAAAQSDDLHQHLLDMLGAKDHADAGRIIGELHAVAIKSR